MAHKQILETERAIEFVKETFSRQLALRLNLTKVSSPIAVMDGTGINDDLNGVERPVAFPIKAMQEKKAVVVHSLAKWKRLRLKQLGIESNQGILTDMRALRPDEDYTLLHSVYVDQWDWEQHIATAQRTIPFLKQTVEKIYEALKETEQAVCKLYPTIAPVLPPKITFIYAEELLQRFPALTVKEREKAICKEYGAVFVIGIGDKLSNGEEHDGRAPDYDDWSTVNEAGFKGLNGDILVWHPQLQNAFELSSMGIRVDEKALLHQLEQRGCQAKASLAYQRMLLDGQLPPSVGGGIGQSRVCMFMLRKTHIGEVQVGLWPEEVRQALGASGVALL